MPETAKRTARVPILGEGVRYVCNKNNVTASPAENPKSWIRQD